MARLLILGYGNPLRGDDGVGWHAVHRLRERSAELDADVMSCHQLTPELAEAVSRAERVIFIDARVGPTPGTVEVSEVAAGAPEYPTFPTTSMPPRSSLWRKGSTEERRKPGFSPSPANRLRTPTSFRRLFKAPCRN